MTEGGKSSETSALAEAPPEPAPPFTPYLRQLRPALVGLVLLTLITGGIYPAVIYGVGRLAFRDQADGSLVRRNGAVVGARLIGQPFARPEYFQPRPSAAGDGYDATQSGGTNLAPANPKLASAVTAAAAAYRRLNGLPANAPLPIDAVTSSGSGLDPHISPENAALQVARVALARGVSQARVRELVARNTEGRDLGFIGQPRVNVLMLNLALDRVAPMARGAAR
jgi:potassium-transporting ATPase KdpC subunit